ncbi:MAG: DUF692 domain-containing protein [Aquabacterium sp.]|uniref:DUF692 domain-containing protein n=1 Tax=Aquabacterium sp. TaxID=1872578 RepID=UPI00271BACB3|nr:DUF692 domain-containing protein [Aquabacterium sp.]MDO9001948.1 DUF692 domain-containing protein [Aquabacterium sp.]
MAALPANDLAGIGLRQPHYQALMALLPPLGFVEVHSENFFGDGGAALAVLTAARDHYPVSLHGVGLSLGSACGLDARHLDKLVRLVEQIEPVRVSDHACFARGAWPGGEMVHASDLLPVAFTPASLDILVRNVGEVQSRLRRPILVENLSAYLSYADDCLPEPHFLAELCRRSGCQLLLDVNNLVVNGLNAARQGRSSLERMSLASDLMAAGEHALAFIQALPSDVVGEVHLAGFQTPVKADQLVVDDHSAEVQPVVWQVYAEAVQRFGPQPTLVEWDTDLPELEVLLAQARQADAVATRAMAARS